MSTEVTVGQDKPPERKPEESRSLASSPVTDMKAGLTGTKVQLSQLPRNALVYAARAMQYGDDKYARGNYHRPAPEGSDPIKRALGYLDADLRHALDVTDAITRAIGTGGDIKAAVGCVDDKHDGKFPPSLLPHLAHLAASVLLTIETAINDGLIPADPGAPWKPHVGTPVESWPGTNTAPVVSPKVTAVTDEQEIP